MPGTPIAKSDSFVSVNSFTCRAVMSCSASARRSSGRIGGSLSGASSPWMRSVGGRPTLRWRSDAFCWTSCCSTPFSWNAPAGAEPPGAAWGAVVGLAIGVDPEEDLAVLHGLRVLDPDLPDDARELRLDLVHDLHRLDDAEHLSLRDARAHRNVRFRTGLRRSVERADHRRLHLEVGRLRRLGLGGLAPLGRRR